MYARDYRQLAAKKMKGNYLRWIFALLIIALITNAVFTTINVIISGEEYFDKLLLLFSQETFSQELLNSVISGSNIPTIIATIVNIFLLAPIGFGIHSLALKTVRNDKPQISNIFYCFTDYARVLLLQLVNAFFLTLYALLLIIPAIIKSYAYSMSGFVLIDNPHMTHAEARRESIRLMQGNKMRLFYLQISYIGWILLSIMTFGILLIWVIPRMLIAQTEFYESLINKPFNDNYYNSQIARNLYE